MSPLHLWTALTANGTEGRCAEREEEEGGYTAERGEDSREDGGEEKWGEDTKMSLGDGSGAIGASTTGNKKYLVLGVDGTTG